MVLYVAVVIDTDGSAFITKAEFDSLKNNFQKQVDNYNASIDAKIDGAIASYLAGIRTQNVEDGENFIRKLNKVTFWSPNSTSINSSAAGNLRRLYMWKYFGVFYGPQSRFAFSWVDEDGNPLDPNSTTRSYLAGWAPSTDVNWHRYIAGSFLLDLFSYVHSRKFEFQAAGSATNYFYLIKNYNYNNNDYISLTDNCSKTVTQTCGGFYLHGDLASKTWDGITRPATFSFIHRDEVLPYTTNSFEPSTINVDLKLSNYTSALPGATFNVWMKKNNTADSNFLYDFTNTGYSETQTMTTFTNDSFQNWTQEYKFVGSQRVAGDWWMSFVGPGGDFRRVYTWRNENFQRTGDPMIAIPVDQEHGTMLTMQPEFKSYTSSKIINGKASEIINRPVYPYNGAPLTSIPQNAKGMEVLFNVEIYDATETLKTGVGYDIVLSCEPFTNVSTDTIITAGETDKIKIFTNSTGSNSFTINLDETYLAAIPKGTILYIRVVPKTDKNNYHICVDCDEVTFYTEI